MRRPITIPLECLTRLFSWVIRSGVLTAVMLLVASSAWGGPVFLGISADESQNRPVEVFAGRRSEFVLTLSSTSTDTPFLSGDFFAVAGGLATPLAKNISFPLQRVGEAKVGMQRFKFSLEIPATKRKQVLILKLKTRTGSSDEWLPLPAVTLSSMPVTWKESFQQFAHQLPCGRMTGGDKLQRLFQTAGIETIEFPEGQLPNDPAIRVWFAESSDAEFQLPPLLRTVGVIFKKNISGGIDLWRPAPQSSPCVLVDAGILDRIDTDPAAQEIFERALSMARALIPISSELTQSP